MRADQYVLANVAVGVALGLVAGCGVGAPPNTSPTWPDPLTAVSSSHLGAPPPFPEKPSGWTLTRSWTVRARAFTGEWTPVAGVASDNYRFPASQNGCDQGLFLVRWRNIEDTDTAIRYGVITGVASTNPPIAQPSEPQIGRAGWLVLDGCQTPEVSMLSRGANGATLTNLVVEVEALAPAI